MDNYIEIKTTTSYGAAEAVKAFIDGIGADSVKAARLNTKGGVPYEHVSSEEWPLVLECSTNKDGLKTFEIRIYMLSSGFGGTGPHDLVGVLKHAGFHNFDEERVFNEEFEHERWLKRT